MPPPIAPRPTRRPARLFLVLAALAVLLPAMPPSAEATGIEACFTPGEDCTSRIVGAIDRARHTVLVQAYSFTAWPIARALMKAHDRGVDVRMIMDGSAWREYRRTAERLARAHIPLLIDAPPGGIAHSKVMVIDDQVVITGSFNFTRAAQEDNAENLLVIDDPALAARYAANWQRRAALSHKPTRQNYK